MDESTRYRKNTNGGYRLSVTLIFPCSYHHSGFPDTLEDTHQHGLLIMNIKQLKAFKEVMITGSVSKAATNLFRTQPAVSAQLTSLENEIGMALFERREGRLHPVPEAEYLLCEAVEILDKIENLEDNLTRVRNLETGKINIVSMLSPSIFFLPNLISEFVKGRGNVDVSLLSQSSFQAQQLMSAQGYDVGIVDHVSQSDSSFSLINHERLDYQCLCAVSVDDPLAKKSYLTAEDLNHKPLAMLSESHATHAQLKQVFEEKNLILNIRFETQYFLPQLSFVENGLACALIDPITVASYKANCIKHSNVVFLPFKPNITFSISIVTPAHRPLSLLASEFVTILKAELEKLQ